MPHNPLAGDPIQYPPSLTCKSCYITLPDGVRIAASSWLSKDEIDNGQQSVEKRPVVLWTTRYWRAIALNDYKTEWQWFYTTALEFFLRGYVLVIADVRGTGASFGHRDAEISPQEVDDIGEIIQWIAKQEWCDGRVTTSGTSYTANTTLCSLVTAPEALKIGVCRAPDFDGYRHLLAPGGVVNNWFIDGWGELTAAMDQNDVATLYKQGAMPTPASGLDNLQGVRPVDEDHDGRLLALAVAEHTHNYNLARTTEEGLRYAGNKPLGSYRYIFEQPYKKRVDNSGIPLVITCGWHDAGTQLGALSMFASFDNPIRVILDNLNHSSDYRADPFFPGDGSQAEAANIEEVRALTIDALDVVIQPESQNRIGAEVAEDYFGVVEYYTLGENCWKTTREWPLTNTDRQRWYFAAEHQLSQTAPDSSQGSDVYQVDPDAGTGFDNRWHAQALSKPILFPDRRDADKKLLVYDTPPLEKDTEITGHPVVHMQLSSTATDGQFFVYLETVDPDGRVRMLTEGQLRGLHRKVSKETPPYIMFGPYHSLKEKDAMPMVPGEVTEIAFDLFPISVLLKKGQRIRVAIAGADKDVFAPIAGCESPELTVERNSIHSSYIDLPIIPREDKL